MLARSVCCCTAHSRIYKLASVLSKRASETFGLCRLYRRRNRCRSVVFSSLFPFSSTTLLLPRRFLVVVTGEIHLKKKLAYHLSNHDDQVTLTLFLTKQRDVFFPLNFSTSANMPHRLAYRDAQSMPPPFHQRRQSRVIVKIPCSSRSAIPVDLREWLEME
jgi:hypothetical protein